MRKIETRINDIVLGCLRGKYAKSFDKQLTKRDRIRYQREACTVDVFLWNSIIATFAVPGPIRSISATTCSISHCGYETSTTKSRLNALLGAFHRDDASLFQRDFVWHISVDTPTRHKTAKFDRLTTNGGRYRFLVHC